MVLVPPFGPVVMEFPLFVSDVVCVWFWVDRNVPVTALPAKLARTSDV